MSEAVPTGALLPYGRWAGLSALLVGEILLLSIWFDTPILGGDGAIPRFIRENYLVHLAVGAMMTAVVLLVIGLHDRLHGLAGELRGNVWPALLGHLGAFSLLFWVSSRALEPGRGGLAVGAWLVPWAAVGLATILSWIAAAIPIGLWGGLARRVLLMTAICLGVAVLAGLMGRLSAAVLWTPLNVPTFRLVHALMSLFWRDVVCIPSQQIIGTSSFRVSVSTPCCGYEGIGLISVFLAGYLWLDRERLRFPAALLLFPIGIAVIWVANVVRIVALLAVGTWVSPDAAIHGFHSQGGWLAFNAVSLGLIGVARHTRLFAKAEQVAVLAPAGEAGANFTVAYLAPGMALLAATLITSAFSAGGFDSLYPARVAATVVALWIVRRDLAALPRGGSLSAILLGVVAFVVWMALEPRGATYGPTPAALAGMSRPWAVAWLACRVFGSVVTVPIAEELAFRGYLSRRLIGRDFQEVDPRRVHAVSALLSSLLFGALHQRWLAGTLAGLVYAIAYRRRGRVSDAVWAHATTNSLIAACVLVGGRWDLWT